MNTSYLVLERAGKHKIIVEAEKHQESALFLSLSFCDFFDFLFYTLGGVSLHFVLRDLRDPK